MQPVLVEDEDFFGTVFVVIVNYEAKLRICRSFFLKN